VVYVRFGSIVLKNYLSWVFGRFRGNVTQLDQWVRAIHFFRIG
jgi:hypothetical protein